MVAKVGAPSGEAPRCLQEPALHRTRAGWLRVRGESVEEFSMAAVANAVLGPASITEPLPMDEEAREVGESPEVERSDPPDELPDGLPFVAPFAKEQMRVFMCRIIPRAATRPKVVVIN